MPPDSCWMKIIGKVSHLYVFFGEMSIYFFGPVFDCVIYFSRIELQELLVYFWDLLFVSCFICYYLLPFWRLSFLSLSIVLFSPTVFGSCNRVCNICRFDPWVRNIPWSRKWQPTQVFLPGNSCGQRGLAGYSYNQSKLFFK